MASTSHDERQRDVSTSREFPPESGSRSIQGIGGRPESVGNRHQADRSTAVIENAGRGKRGPRRASWYYACLVLGTLVLIRVVGERWWPVLGLLYMPRWLFLLPALILAPAAIIKRDRLSLAVVGVTLGLVAGPLMGLNLNLQRPEPPLPGTAGFRLRIMTLNRGTNGIDAVRLIQLIERERIDIICFQELGGNPVLREYWKQGWWRTDFVASRWPILAECEPLDEIEAPHPDWATRLEWAGSARPRE